MFINQLRETGVQFQSPQIPKGKNNPHGLIAKHVWNQHFKAYRDEIRNSDAYQEYHDGYAPNYSGPHPENTPHLPSLSTYLHGHSIRKGFLGKLAGLAYKVCETVKDILRMPSDRSAARKSVENMLVEIEKLKANGNPEVVTVSKEMTRAAKALLENALADYNKYARGN